MTVGYPSDHERSDDAGFSMVEVLVAIIVLSLTVLALNAALGTVRRSVGVLIETPARAQVDAVQSFLRDVLENAQAAPLAIDKSDHRIFFDGGPQKLSFATNRSGGTATSGLNITTIESSDRTNEHSNGKMSLLVSTSVLRRGDSDAGQRYERVLLSPIQNLTFMYFGGPDQEWRDQWTVSSQLPQLIRVVVSFPPGDPRIWSELIVAPRASSLF